MTTEHTPEPIPETSAIVVSPETDALVETEMVGQDDVVKQETKALIEAIKQRAQSEIQSAGEISREAYLSAVRQARESIERHKIFEPDRVDQSLHSMQREAEKNWNALSQEVEQFGIRLANAAKAAWEELTQPNPPADR